MLVHVSQCLFVCVSGCVYVCMCLQFCLYMCVCLRLCVCVCPRAEQVSARIVEKVTAEAVAVLKQEQDSTRRLSSGRP